MVLKAWRYSSKHTASHPRTYVSSGVILAVALTPAMFFCVNKCQYCLRPLTYYVTGDYFNPLEIEFCLSDA